MKFYPLTVSDIRRETAGAVSVAFSVPDELKDEFRYIPGQYITLKKDIGDEDVRRAYSICTAPWENELRVAIKKVENGKFSTFANEQLKAGDVLDVLPPLGSFYVDYDAPGDKTYVAFVAGSGITPVMSIMKHVLHERKNDRIVLFYGNKTVDSVIFGKEIDGLKSKYPNRLSVHYIYSRDNFGTPDFYGRINREKLEVWAGKAFPLSADHFFLCGPEGMILDAKQFLEERGVSENKIKFELFTASGGSQKPDEDGAVSPAEDVHAHITAIIDDDEFEFELDRSGKSILEAGLEADIDMPFSCKGGVCSTCKAKILEGSAEMKLNYSLLDEEVEAGYILTCQSHPTSEKLVISFDE